MKLCIFLFVDFSMYVHMYCFVNIKIISVNINLYWWKKTQQNVTPTVTGNVLLYLTNGVGFRQNTINKKQYYVNNNLLNCLLDFINNTYIRHCLNIFACNFTRTQIETSVNRIKIFFSRLLY